MLTVEEMNAAPSWERSWSRHWAKRDKLQFEQPVYRCPRCSTKEHGARHVYGREGSGFKALELSCGHFVKEGAVMPVAL